MAQALIWPVAAPALGVAIALCSTLPVAWRRARPVAAVVAGSVPWLVPTDGRVVFGYAAACVLYYSLAVHVRRPYAPVAFGIAVAALSPWISHEPPGAYAAALSAVAVPTLAGRLVRHQRRQDARLRELAEELQHERERTAQLAVAEERARIARELHDVVAQALRAIATEADAALDRDPELAGTPLRAIRRSAEQALGELRRLLALGEEAEPQPGLAQLPALVERARAAGMPVTLYVDGTPRPLPASVDLSAFRIVQEALTNVHKHARGAPASVRVVWRLQTVSVQVRDTGNERHPEPDDEGHGLVGIRERVKLHGGELHTGALPGGGFEITARLPL